MSQVCHKVVLVHCGNLVETLSFLPVPPLTLFMTIPEGGGGGGGGGGGEGAKLLGGS